MHRIAGEFNTRRCVRCGTVWLDPQPKDDVLAAHYPQDYACYTPSSAATRSRPPSRTREILLQSRPLRRLAAVGVSRLRGREMLRLAEHFPRPGKVLDIGCGTGSELDVFARLGWATFGVEMSADAAAVAAAHGHEVAVGPFPETDTSLEIAASGPFDLIFMHHSLEHLRSPVAALATARDLLGSGGAIFVATPNAGGYLARRFIRHWWQLDAPRHLVLFTRAGLTAVADRAGLNTLWVRTYSNAKGRDITRRLGADPAVTIIPDLPDGSARPGWTSRVMARAADAAGNGDNLHALLEPKR